MTKADLFSLLDRREIAGVYVFGSYLHKSKPGDIDVLVVYHEQVCPHHCAHKLLRRMLLKLESFFAADIHLTLLSDTETAHNAFVDSENCISLTEVLSAR